MKTSQAVKDTQSTIMTHVVLGSGFDGSEDKFIDLKALAAKLVKLRDKDLHTFSVNQQAPILSASRKKLDEGVNYIAVKVLWGRVVDADAGPTKVFCFKLIDDLDLPVNTRMLCAEVFVDSVPTLQ